MIAADKLVTFLFQNGNMIPRVQSSGRFSECQTSWMMCVSHRVILLSPALSISDVILQMPVARLFFSSCTAFFRSFTITGSVEHTEMAQRRVKKLPDPNQDLLQGGGANY